MDLMMSAVRREIPLIWKKLMAKLRAMIIAVPSFSSWKKLLSK
jgi:hypothetical protein